jgi:hypothetical protein
MVAVQESVHGPSQSLNFGIVHLPFSLDPQEISEHTAAGTTFILGLNEPRNIVTAGFLQP